MSPSNAIEVVARPKNVCGEGPHWAADQGCLYYVDIPAKRLLKYDAATGKNTSTTLAKGTPDHVTLVVPVRGRPGVFAVGLGRSIVLAGWSGEDGGEAEVLETVCAVEEGKDHRFNDGKADRQGRLWAGTMPLEDPKTPGVVPLHLGALYRLDAGGAAKEVLDKVSLSNGLDWTEDSGTFYFIDSLAHKVEAFDHDPATGALTNRRFVFDMREAGIEAILDGMAIDTRGNLWIALFKGSKVLEVQPSKSGGPGKVLGCLEFPDCLHLTSVAFGGPDLGDLYVTSAGLSGGDPALGRDAGSLFRVRGLRSHQDDRRVFGYPGREVAPEFVDKQK